jgi:folate-dependent phosphoribosylglycinamide formyltransferase PurN
MKKRIGILLSGRGSNFEALAASVASGGIPHAEISLVISPGENAPGIESKGFAHEASKRAGDGEPNERVNPPC